MVYVPGNKNLNVPPTLLSEPCMPLFGVILHVLLTIVLPDTVNPESMSTGVFAGTLAGAVIPVSAGGCAGAVTVIVLSVVLVPPLLSVTVKRMA